MPHGCACDFRDAARAAGRGIINAYQRAARFGFAFCVWLEELALWQAGVSPRRRQPKP